MRSTISVICTSVLGLAGCRSAAPTPAVATPAPASKCAQVADRFVTFYPIKVDETAPPELTSLFHAIVVERCEQDRWSMQVQDCYVAPDASVDECAKSMTPQQRTSFQEEAETKLVAAAKQLGAQRAGEGAPPPSPPPPPPPPAPAAAPALERADKTPDAPAQKTAPPKKQPRRATPRPADPCEGGE